MKYPWIVVTVACAALLAAGCGRIISEGAGVVVGGKGVTVVIKKPPTDLTEYGTFRVETFADKTGTGTPANLQPLFEQQFREMLAKKGIPIAGRGTRTLTIRGTFLYYESARFTLSQAISPIEEVVARVQLVDGHQVIAEANCVGRSTATSANGVETKAQGLAKAIVKWIENSYPKPPKDE